MRLFVVNSNYPLGKTETFLENEILHIHNKFQKVYLFPLNYPAGDTSIRDIPDNVIAFPPVMPESNLLRITQGIFSDLPFKPHLKELKKIIDSGSDHFSDKLKRWVINTTVLRAFFNSESFSFLESELKEEDILYFYWCRKTVYFADILKHKNTFIRLHGGEIDLDRYSNFIPFYDNILKSDVFLLPISEKARNGLLKFRPNINNKISRLGTYDSGLNPKLESEVQPIVLVSCSNLISLKRVRLIIDALENISKLNIKWVHFGDGPEMESLISEAESKLSENIKFDFKGRVENAEVLKFYKEHHVDLFINVSESEGLPVSIMEAMSFGIPCFATSVGATDELVNNENGILVEKNFSISSLTKAVNSVRSFEHIKKRKLARKKWQKNYRAEINYEKLGRIFLEANESCSVKR